MKRRDVGDNVDQINHISLNERKIDKGSVAKKKGVAGKSSLKLQSLQHKIHFGDLLLSAYLGYILSDLEICAHGPWTWTVGWQETPESSSCALD